jgi:C4-dicarboxylate-specific signal transduction histidine kinase
MYLRWRSQIWFPFISCIVGVAALILLSYVGALLGVDLAEARFWLIVAVVAASMIGSYISSVVLSVVAATCLYYFFVPPTFSFRVDWEEDLLALLAFLATSVVITGLVAKIRKMSEEELLYTRSELARFGRVAIVGELTASIAHELTQPLAGLAASGDACRRWLANDPPNIDRANQSLDRIIRDAERARMVVERVRSLVKNTPIQKVELDVGEALHEVFMLIRGEAERDQIKLDIQVGEDMPSVLADRIQFQQVCLNLIVNAIESFKELRSGPRNLRLSAEKDGSDNVLVTVTDTGAGFDSGNSENMFNAFYTTKRDGMGMGLAIGRYIIEAHGGRLWASANSPRGAKFQFTLPHYRK